MYNNAASLTFRIERKETLSKTAEIPNSLFVISCTEKSQNIVRYINPRANGMKSEIEKMEVEL